MTSLVRKIAGGSREAETLGLAAAVVRRGGVIVYPTETVYGMGANAVNPAAVDRVLAVKGRPSGKPLLVVIPSRAMLAAVAAHISPAAVKVMDAFWPGPLTIVVPARADLPPGLTGGSGTIGVRVPSHPVTLRLLELLGLPLVSTSANRSGGAVGPTVEVIRDELGDAIDLYLDAGQLAPSPPSTVVDLSGETPRIVREGAIAAERLRALLPSLAPLTSR